MENLKIFDRIARDAVNVLNSPDYKFLRVFGSSRDNIDSFCGAVHRAFSPDRMDYSLVDVEVDKTIGFDALCRMTESQNGRLVLCLKDYQDGLSSVPGMYTVDVDGIISLYASLKDS